MDFIFTADRKAVSAAEICRAMQKPSELDLLRRKIGDDLMRHLREEKIRAARND